MQAFYALFLLIYIDVHFLFAEIDKLIEYLSFQIDLTSWVLVHTTRDTRCGAEFEGMMQKVGPQMGIQVCKPNMVSLKDDRTESYLRALRDCINPHVQVVVIIFPTSRDDRYAAVKKLCCAEIPVASQVQ